MKTAKRKIESLKLEVEAEKANSEALAAEKAKRERIERAAAKAAAFEEADRKNK